MPPEEFLTESASFPLKDMFDFKMMHMMEIQLKYKGYKAILTLNPKDNRLWGQICTPENPSMPMDSWYFSGNNINEAQERFRYQVEKIISYKEFNKKCVEWKNRTDFESIRIVMNILPDEFKQRVTENKFDRALLDSVKGGDYEVPLYYVTKAWDIILKGELCPLDLKIGPEEDEDCTEADIKEFLAEEDATRSRCEACKDNDTMKKHWKELFDIDIDSLDIDFLLFCKHLPPNVTYKEYQEYFRDVPDGIDEWILDGINHPNNESVFHDKVSSLMEFTAEVLLRRKGELW